MFKDPPMTPEERKAELEDLRHEPLLHQLRNDIRIEVARDLPKFRAREKELSALETGDLLEIYMNWKHRQVHPHPRRVWYSAELSERIRTNDGLYAPVESQFRELVKIITNGEDLLSRKILSPGIVRKPYQLTPDCSHLNREDHLDLMLNEQGIHHLHLPGLERKKGAPIVFAIFDASHAFLLDLARHDEYQTDRFARISYENWPQRHFLNMKVDHFMDGKGNEIDLNDQQRTDARNDAINIGIKMADHTYLWPRAGGIMANGFAQAVVRRSDQIWTSLSLFAIRRYRERFDEYYLEVTGKPLPDDPVFRFKYPRYED